MTTALRSLLRGLDRLPQALLSLVVAVMLVVIAYPEVVFGGGSLHAGDIGHVVDRTAVLNEEVGWYPNPENRPLHAGMRDLGARVFQTEPGVQVMERAIHDGESPLWDPYTGSGAPGPESLVNALSSPVTILGAAAGGTPTAWTFVLLGSVVLSLYCLQQLFVRTLALGRYAAVGASIVFYLNGWAAGQLSSHVAVVPYLLFPVVLYAQAEFVADPKPLRLLRSTAAYAALLMTPFTPGVVLTLIGVQPLVLAIDLRRRLADLRGGGRRAAAGWTLRLVGRQALAPATGLLLTLWLWLPLVDTLGRTEDLETYSSRVIQTAPAIQWLSVITPRHAYTSYLLDTFPSSVTPNAWTIYLGIIPLLVIVAALPRARGLARMLLWLGTGVVVLAIGMHLGVPGFGIVGDLPGLAPIGQVYWSSLAGMGLTIAVGAAISTATREGLDLRWATVGAGLILLAMVGTITGSGRWMVRTTVATVIALAFVAALLALLRWLGRAERQRTALVLGLVLALMLLELLTYQQHTRTPRDHDVMADPPEYVEFLQENLGSSRILNIGRAGLAPNWGSAFAIRQSETRLHNQSTEYRQLFAHLLAVDGRVGKFLLSPGRDLAVFDVDPVGLDIMAIKYLIVDDRWTETDALVAEQYPLALYDEDARIKVYENPDALPRAWLGRTLEEPGVDETESNSDGDIVLTTDERLLEEAEALTNVAPRTPQDVDIVVDDTTHVAVEVESATSSVLVLADNYDERWKATIDEEPAYLGRVNTALRGVVVPAGRHRVDFRYENEPFSLGLRIGAATLVALLLGCAGWAILRRVRDPSGDPAAARR